MPDGSPSQRRPGASQRRPSEPKIQLARLFEKTSAAGRRYFVGRLGPSRLLLFANQRGEPGEWALFVQAIPAEQANDGTGEPVRRRTRQPARRQPAPPATDHGDNGRLFDDPLDDIGRGP